jgi:methylated-DNA-[protein]-cysteine S-methyltransferase
MTLFTLCFRSPVGPLRLVASPEALLAIELPGHDQKTAAAGSRHPLLQRARAQLLEYFAGRRRTFELPLAPNGTEFQQAVWRELQAIPFGETRSYTDLARRLGRPGAARAVGAANGQNPIPIVLPCHRVVGADGSLTGYAGGLAMKRWLLAHEGAAPAGDSPLLPGITP